MPNIGDKIIQEMQKSKQMYVLLSYFNLYDRANKSSTNKSKALPNSEEPFCMSCFLLRFNQAIIAVITFVQNIYFVIVWIAEHEKAVS